MAKITNEFLAQFKKLQAQKSKVDKELEDMKNVIKAEIRAGSKKETTDFVASIRLDKSVRVCSKEVCIELLKQTEKALIKSGVLVECESRVVVVDAKGE